MSDRHLIDKAEFLVDFTTEAEALACQDALAPLINERLMNVVSQVFDENAETSGPPRRFDRLEVDLGAVGSVDDVATLEARLKQSLRDAIADAERGQPAAAPADTEDGGDGVDVLDHYLQCGTLPWHSRLNSVSAADALFESLVRMPAGSLRGYLQQRLADGNAASRFARFCPTGVRDRLLDILCRDNASQYRAMLDLLARSDSLDGNLPQDAALWLRERVLTSALCAPSPGADPVSVIETCIADCAIRYRLPPHGLAETLRTRASHSAHAEGLPPASPLKRDATFDPGPAESGLGSIEVRDVDGPREERGSTPEQTPLTRTSLLPDKYSRLATQADAHAEAYDLLTRTLEEALSTAPESAADTLVEKLERTAPWLLQRVFEVMRSRTISVEALARHPRRRLSRILLDAYLSITSTSTDAAASHAAHLQEAVHALGGAVARPEFFYARVLLGFVNGGVPDLQLLAREAGGSTFESSEDARERGDRHATDGETGMHRRPDSTALDSARQAGGAQRAAMLGIGQSLDEFLGAGTDKVLSSSKASTVNAGADEQRDDAMALIHSLGPGLRAELSDLLNGSIDHGAVSKALRRSIGRGADRFHRLLEGSSESSLAKLFLLSRPAHGGDLLVLAELLINATTQCAARLSLEDAHKHKWTFLLGMHDDRDKRAVTSDLLERLADVADGPTAQEVRVRALAAAPAGLHRFIGEALRSPRGIDDAFESPTAHTAATAAVDETADIGVSNAGLVIAAAYLPKFFNMLGMLDDGDLLNRRRAVHLLQLLVEPAEPTPEFGLVLNKLLCGLSPAEPVFRSIEVQPRELEVARSLLGAIVDNWAALGTCSVATLQASFIQRNGVLRMEDDTWQLDVEQTGLDVLLDRLPWSLSVIKHPWMDTPIHVNWR